MVVLTVQHNTKTFVLMRVVQTERRCALTERFSL